MKNNDRSAAYKEREQRRAAAQAREMNLMYKFIYITCAAILGVLAVLTIKKNGDFTVAFLTKAQMPIVVVCAVLTLAAAVYFVIQRKKGADEDSRVVTSTSLLAIAFGALVLFLSYSFIGLEYDTARIISLIVLAVLYFVYHIYNSVFFTVSVQCALGVLAVGVLSKTSVPTGLRAVGAVAAVVLCTVGAYILLRLISGKNASAVKDYKFYIMAAIVIAGVLLSLIIPAITTYAIFAILAVYVVNAVISTIEMM
ncbi:MAG: hypothetical protein IJ391_00865 [Clostridia bacterium]|nr:hypothetical protein [Clostridia bacterium]